MNAKGGVSASISVLSSLQWLQQPHSIRTVFQHGSVFGSITGVSFSAVLIVR